ncbi:FAD-dependent oxidoreductase [Paenibacillus chitinolyticus]
MKPFDVIIVGARCGGASLAIFLAQKGYSVCMVDKTVFPSDNLSTHVFGGWELYAQLNVEGAIKKAGAPEMTRFRVGFEECSFEAPMVVTPSVCGLRRIKHDQILLDETVKHPQITFMPNCRLTGLLYEGEEVCGITVKEEETIKNLYGKVIVGADGRDSDVANLAGAAKYNVAESPRCIFYAYYKQVTLNPLPTFEFYWSDHDIVLVNPCDEDLHCLVVMPLQEHYKTWARSPDSRLRHKISQLSSLSSRFSGAQMIGKARGTDRLESYLRQSYGRGWALVGDAGAAVHPCAGAGIEQAMACSKVLAACIDDFLTGRLPWSQAMDRYTEFRDPYVQQNMNAALSLAKLPPVQTDVIPWVRLISTLPTFTHKFIHQIPGFISSNTDPAKFNGLKGMLGIND